MKKVRKKGKRKINYLLKNKSKKQSILPVLFGIALLSLFSETLRTVPAGAKSENFRNLPFELREEDIAPSDALIGDFSEAKDVKAKIAILELMLKDLSLFDDPASQLKDVIVSISPLFVVTFRSKCIIIFITSC